MRFEALLFDLFGTVVHFAATVPTVSAGGESRRTTLGWLEDTIAQELPGVDFDDFLGAVFAVTKEIVAARPPEYVEVPSPERFRRALLRLDVAADAADTVGRRLSLVHMRHLASQTVLPAGHRELLDSLRQRYRIGLVSNFDHGPTALDILRRHGVIDLFESITVSDGYGRRKPHPSIFLHAVASLDAQPERTLFVGDSVADDVAGAKAAGLAVVLIDPTGEAARDAEGVRPDFVVRELAGLEPILERVLD